MIVTDVTAVTAWLVAVNVAVVAPAGIVTDAGTFAALVLLLLRPATMPPAGAAVARVTVPMLVAPPVTVAGFIASPASHGFTPSVAVCDDPLYVAVMTAPTAAATGFVVMANVAEAAPASTATEAGTVAAAVLLLVSATTAPAGGAGADSVTVPVLPIPPVTEAGFTPTETSDGFTISSAEIDAPR